MHISSMTIDNYRTFRHVVFQFDRQVNYMVGDNNIGKSNFLCLLKWISHGYGFREGDFLDADGWCLLKRREGRPQSSIWCRRCRKWCHVSLIGRAGGSCPWSTCDAFFISIFPCVRCRAG